MVLLFIPIFYLSYNMYQTEPLDSIATIRDGWTAQQRRDRQAQAKAKADAKAAKQSTSQLAGEHNYAHVVDERAYSIDDIMDIPLERVNQLLYQQKR